MKIKSQNEKVNGYYEFNIIIVDNFLSITRILQRISSEKKKVFGQKFSSSRII